MKKKMKKEKAENKPACFWTKKEDGIIYSSVTTDGTTGEGWIERFGDECNKDKIREAGSLENILCSSEFKPTNNMTFNLAIGFVYAVP